MKCNMAILITKSQLISLEKQKNKGKDMWVSYINDVKMEIL